MPSVLTKASSGSTTMTRRLAEWIYDFGAPTTSTPVAERTRFILLDRIGCALSASAVEKSEPILRSLSRLGGSDDCTIIGSRMCSALPTALFANGSLIRLLDLNDTYTGPGQVGHPSDNIGVALAAAETADRAGKELASAICKASSQVASPA